MIHKFSMNGYNIVLDVDGGSVHILDDVAYELVDLYSPVSSPSVSVPFFAS